MHDAGHAQQHEREHERGGADEHVQVKRLVQRVAQHDQQRRGEARAGQQREPRAREPGLGLSRGRAEQAHRGMQGGGTDQREVRRPAGAHEADQRMAAIHQFDAVEHIARQQRDGACEQQRERRLASTSAGGDAGDDGEHEDVHGRVGDRGELAERRQRLPAGVGLDQVDPQQRRERERDDQRVDQGGAIAVFAAFANQQQHADDQQRVEGEVQRVGDRRKRHRPTEQPLVVEGQNLAGHEQALGDGQQVPGQPPSGAVLASADDQRADAGAADQVEHEPASQPGGPRQVGEPVATGEHCGQAEIEQPRVAREAPGYAERDA